MKAGLSQARRDRTIALVREAVAMPQWHLANGESYLVTGGPVIVGDLTSKLSHAILLLLVAVAVVMAATLLLVFSERPRLLPLALAGARDGADLRRAGGGGCSVDDGLDRRAAGFGGAVGRLRDPVPGAGWGDRARGGRPGGPHRRRRRTGRAHDRDCRRGQCRRDPRAAAVPGTDGPGLLGAAGRRPRPGPAVDPHRGRRRPRDQQPARGSPRRSGPARLRADRWRRGGALAGAAGGELAGGPHAAAREPAHAGPVESRTRQRGAPSPPSAVDRARCSRWRGGRWVRRPACRPTSPSSFPRTSARCRR